MRSARYKKYPAHINIYTERTTGSAKIIAANPITTARLTKLWPAHNPSIYLKPYCTPKAAPVPASDKTPGPGVIHSKNTALIKDNTYVRYMDFFKHSIVNVGDFITYAFNSHTHSYDQVAQIASSIGEFDLPSWAWFMRIASWSQGMDGSWQRASWSLAKYLW